MLRGDPDERGERVVDRRREAVFGCQPIVDAHDPRPRRSGERLTDRIEFVQAAEDPASAVVVDDGADRIRNRLVDARRDRAARARNLDVSDGRDLGPGPDEIDEEGRPRACLVGRHRGQRRRTGLRDDVEELPGVGVKRHRASCATTAAATSGVPYVWKLSTVFTPQNWPRARSSAVHVMASKSGS